MNVIARPGDPEAAAAAGGAAGIMSVRASVVSNEIKESLGVLRLPNPIGSSPVGETLTLIEKKNKRTEY